MQSFTTLTGIAAPLPLANVDTDMIIPKQFLKTIKRTGLGTGLFHEMRYDVDGNRIENFVLHRPPYNKAQILIAGENFGCGSSREHAPWALLDFGIRCIIAPSFADIFFNNCFKNGMLPIVLPHDKVAALMNYAADSEQKTLTINLQDQWIDTDADDASDVVPFEIDPFRKHCLMNGLDDIGLTLEKSKDIQSFESHQSASQPWLYA